MELADEALIVIPDILIDEIYSPLAVSRGAWTPTPVAATWLNSTAKDIGNQVNAQATPRPRPDADRKNSELTTALKELIVALVDTRDPRRIRSAACAARCVIPRGPIRCEFHALIEAAEEDEEAASNPPSKAFIKWSSDITTEASAIIEELKQAPELSDLYNSRKRTKAPRDEVISSFRTIMAPLETAEEVRRMFMRLPSGKTGGSSGICREHYIHAPDAVLLEIMPFLNKILRGEAPDRIRHGIIAPLLKSDFKLRPITLLEAAWKACMARVSDRLLDVTANHRLLSDKQYAFIRGAHNDTTKRLQCGPPRQPCPRPSMPRRRAGLHVGL
jgi:hypothetical protein